MCVQMPSLPYCQPWYGHMILSPITRPSESAVPRWMHRSRNACAIPAESRHSTRSSPSSRTRNGASVSASAYATGCQQLRSAAKSGTEAGGCSTIMAREYGGLSPARRAAVAARPCSAPLIPRCRWPSGPRRPVWIPEIRAVAGRSPARPSSRRRGTPTASSAACGSRSPGLPRYCQLADGGLLVVKTLRVVGDAPGDRLAEPGEQADAAHGEQQRVRVQRGCASPRRAPRPGESGRACSPMSCSSSDSSPTSSGGLDSGEPRWMSHTVPRMNSENCRYSDCQFSRTSTPNSDDRT